MGKNDKVLSRQGCWVPCWSRLQTKATHARPCRKRRLMEHGQRGFVLLASMLVSSFRGGHHGKGTVEVHVGSITGFQVRFHVDPTGEGRASVSHGVTSNLTWNPVSVPVALAPGGPARSFFCWAEVLEQVSPAGSTGNLTWNPLCVPVASAPVASAPEVSGRRSSQGKLQ